MSSQKFNILFCGEDEKDRKSLLTYLNHYGQSIGLVSMEVDEVAIARVLTSMHSLPWRFGSNQASPFKKVASFVTAFSFEQPIVTPFHVGDIGQLGLSEHQNAITAYSLAVDSLEGAFIVCPFRGRVQLKARIHVSQHFWRELISTLSGANPHEHFHFLALLFESLAYEANPNASYVRTIGRAMPDMVK